MRGPCLANRPSSPGQSAQASSTLARPPSPRAGFLPTRHTPHRNPSSQQLLPTSSRYAPPAGPGGPLVKAGPSSSLSADTGFFLPRACLGPLGGMAFCLPNPGFLLRCGRKAELSPEDMPGEPEAVTPLSGAAGWETRNQVCHVHKQPFGEPTF